MIIHEHTFAQINDEEWVNEIMYPTNNYILKITKEYEESKKARNHGYIVNVTCLTLTNK